MNEAENLNNAETQALNIPVVSNSTDKYKWERCCAEEFKRIWKFGGGSMNVVWYQNYCPICNHYIGLTQTSEKEAIEFLKEYGIVYESR